MTLEAEAMNANHSYSNASQRAHSAAAQVVARPVRRRSRSIVLKSDQSRLRYGGLFKADVDTHSGRPNIEPEYVPDMLSVCLTAYNENAAAYCHSLSALGRASDHFVHAGEPALAQRFTICIVVDGLEKMSASFSAYAQRLGLYQPALLDSRADYHVFDATIERRLLQYEPEGLLAGIAASKSVASPTVTNLSESASRQRIILFIKRDNRGKLDSHRCFFEVICRESRPGYFLQVDVGTIPDPNAVYEMWRHIRENRGVAAVSARSHMPLPRHAADLLGTWQYGDIAAERILLWPTEVFMGYMCVLSGQLCLTRSDAVWSVQAEGRSAPAQAISEPKEDSRVLQSYLRGLKRLGPFESNMFLAEDRILGLEIVFQPDSRWDLDYVPKANAEIDRCETWSELLAQRRRWLCSGVACRLWMFTRVLDYLRSANRSAGQKLRIFSASAFHALYFSIQWLMPAFASIIFACLHHGAVASTSAPWLRRALDVGYAGVVALQAVQLFLSAFCRMNERIDRYFNFSIGYQTLYTLGTAFMVIANFGRAGAAGTLYALGLAIFGTLLLSSLYAREILQGLGKYLVTYWASRPAVAFLIITHAALNSHDTSWGTKGLTRPHHVEEQGAGLRSAPSFTARHFELFRWKTVLTMLCANGVLLAYASNAGWTSTFRGLQVVLALVLAQTAVAMTARVVSIIRSGTRVSSTRFRRNAN